VTVKDAKELEIRIKVQACEKDRCLLPATIAIPVK